MYFQTIKDIYSTTRQIVSINLVVRLSHNKLLLIVLRPCLSLCLKATRGANTHTLSATHTHTYTLTGGWM